MKSSLFALQRGVASATAAAAIYYEERRAQLSCLWYLLQSQALQDTETLDDVQQQVFQYTSALLREQQNGKRKMFTHLLQLIQVLILASELCRHCQSHIANGRVQGDSAYALISKPW